MTSLPLTPLLAHAGEGASWQALLTVVAAGVVVVLGLTLASRVTLDTAGDLTLPLAAVAIVASIAPVAGDPISDAAIYAVPIGAVALVVLIVLAVREAPPRPTEPLVIGAVVAAVALTLLMAPSLREAWYPPEAQRASNAQTDAPGSHDVLADALAVTIG